MKTCRLCLQANVKMFRLRNKEHRDFIESFLKLKGYNYIVSEEHYACYICHALLHKSYNFTQMVVNAQKVLYDFIKADKELTVSDLMNIDRHEKGLNLINLITIHNACDVIQPNIRECIEIQSQKRTKKGPFTKNNLSHLSKKANENKPTSNILSITYNHTKAKDTYIEISDSDIAEQCDNNFNVDDVMKGHDDLISKTNDIHNVKCKGSELVASDVKADKLEVCKIQDERCQMLKKQKNNTSQTKNKSKVEEKEDSYEPSSESESSNSSDTKKKLKTKDKDYQPDSTSHSEDSDFDSYDDTGKAIKQKCLRKYPRKCDHCNYEVQTLGVHYRHYLYMHPHIKYPYGREKIYACSYCGKLESKNRINIHEASHKDLNIKCSLCPKIFKNKARLYSHRSNVHPKKIYICDYCSKSCKTRTDIMLHFRIHTGEKPFKCHICGAGFAHVGNRGIHIRSAHQNFKYVPKKQNTKVRKTKKYDITDTEIESSGEEKLQKKIIKHHHHKNKCNPEEKKNRDKKEGPKLHKSKEKNHTENESKGKEQIQKRPCQSQKDDTGVESDSDMETLAQKVLKRCEKLLPST